MDMQKHKLSTLQNKNKEIQYYKAFSIYRRNCRVMARQRIQSDFIVKADVLVGRLMKMVLRIADIKARIYKVAYNR